MGAVLVLGGSGKLGHALREELERRGIAFEAPTRDVLDLAGPGAAADWIEAAQPAMVLNAAGFTNVPACELDDNKAEVERLNAGLPEELATTCAKLSLPLLHVSTDYVFDGAHDHPYREADRANPLQEYGRSKLQGERAVLKAH